MPVSDPDWEISHTHTTRTKTARQPHHDPKCTSSEYGVVTVYAVLVAFKAVLELVSLLLLQCNSDQREALRWHEP